MVGWGSTQDTSRMAAGLHVHVSWRGRALWYLDRGRFSGKIEHASFLAHVLPPTKVPLGSLDVRDRNLCPNLYASCVLRSATETFACTATLLC